jgi:hypothetical protein
LAQERIKKTCPGQHLGSFRLDRPDSQQGAAVRFAQVAGEVEWMAVKQVPHPSVDERKASGKTARERTSKASKATGGR